MKKSLFPKRRRNTRRRERRAYHSMKNESHERTRKNPYKRPPDERHALKKKIEVILLILTTAALLGITIFHPFFHVSRLDVVGLQRISADEFDDSVRTIMTHRHWFVFPGNNYFFVDTGELRDILLEKFPIHSIIVQKTFPHTLSIVLEEKISTLIYDNGKQYSYVGLDGHIVEVIRNVGEDEWTRETEITTSTLADGTIRTEEHIISETHVPPVRIVLSEMGDYPIVYDKRQKASALNEVVLKDRTVEETIAWFHFLNKEVGAPFRHMELENELGDAVIFTQEGWYIKVKLDRDKSIQFQALQAVLEERGGREGLGYVDLRYGDRVYWR